MPEEIAGTAPESVQAEAPAHVQIERFTVPVNFASTSANENDRTIDASGTPAPRFPASTGARVRSTT